MFVRRAENLREPIGRFFLSPKQAENMRCTRWMQKVGRARIVGNNWEEGGESRSLPKVLEVRTLV